MQAHTVNRQKEGHETMKLFKPACLLFLLFLVPGIALGAKPIEWTIPGAPGLLSVEYYDVSVNYSVWVLHNQAVSGGEHVKLDFAHTQSGAEINVILANARTSRNIPWAPASQKIVNYTISYHPFQGEESYVSVQVNGTDGIDPTWDPYASVQVNGTDGIDPIWDPYVSVQANGTDGIDPIWDPYVSVQVNGTDDIGPIWDPYVINPNFNPRLENELGDSYLWHQKYTSDGTVSVGFRDESTNEFSSIVENLSVSAGTFLQIFYQPNPSGQHIELTYGSRVWKKNVTWKENSQKLGVIEMDYQPPGTGASRYVDFSIRSK